MKAPITYTAQEYTNMLLCYGAANCISSRAKDIYRAKYPDNHLPPPSMFLKTFQRILENEPIRPNSKVKVRDVIDSKALAGKIKKMPRKNHHAFYCRWLVINLGRRFMQPKLKEYQYASTPDVIAAFVKLKSNCQQDKTFLVIIYMKILKTVLSCVRDEPEFYDTRFN